MPINRKAARRPPPPWAQLLIVVMMAMAMIPLMGSVVHCPSTAVLDVLGAPLVKGAITAAADAPVVGWPILGRARRMASVAHSVLPFRPC